MKWICILCILIVLNIKICRYHFKANNRVVNLRWNCSSKILSKFRILMSDTLVTQKLLEINTSNLNSLGHLCTWNILYDIQCMYLTVTTWNDSKYFTSVYWFLLVSIQSDFKFGNEVDPSHFLRKIHFDFETVHF